MNKTKIVATLGPSSQDKINQLIEAGVNVFRLNFSHGTHEIHKEYIKSIRYWEDKIGVPVGILQDLSGPKIRLGEVKEPFYVKYGDIIKIVKEQIIGTKEALSINYPEILDQLKPGDRIYIADGTIRLKVIEKTEDGIIAKVILGGLISSRKGVNFPKIHLNIPALTQKDKEDIKFGIQNGVDIIALSFVKNPQDVLDTKSYIKSIKDIDIPVFAKIEKHEAVENIDSILEVSDGIMVARGDLGVEIEMEKVPVIQKMLIKKANENAKPVITATQMLISMVSSMRPTRAEVSDIANAVLDGTDAVMLSDETTIGKYPVEAVSVMKKTIEETEKIYNYYRDMSGKVTPDEAIANASSSIAKDIQADGIIVFTTTGRSARTVSKFRPKCPIFVVSHDIETLRRATIIWGVVPFETVEKEEDPEIMLCKFIRKLKNKGKSLKGNFVVTIGSIGNVSGKTNMIRIMRQEDIEKISCIC
ncbi:MAG: pyruvate kinase [Aquificae bacterium]|nr:pyruvate kinase [Aquificota bacterium]